MKAEQRIFLRSAVIVAAINLVMIGVAGLATAATTPFIRHRGWRP